jgi:hypothetical protein
MKSFIQIVVIFALLLPGIDSPAEEENNEEAPQLLSEATKGETKLELELPQPLFVGTPQNIKSSNLAKQTGKPRGDVFVQEGIVLLSREAYVTSSDDAPIIGELEMVTDGDKEGAEGSYVELGPGPQWVQIELDEPAEIHVILIWHYHSQARAYHDVAVQAASDEDMLENVVTIYNNDHDNSLGLGIGEDKEWIETFEGKLIDGKATKAEHLRFYSNGSTSSPMNHYVEIEVFGRPASD